MHTKRNSLLALVMLLALTVAARADKVDEYVKAEMKKQHIPGVSIAVVKDGKVIKAEGYGLANVELNVPARADTVYKIGSVSKQFIASGIMLLAEDQKLSLDDRISKYLEGTPDTWKDIPIRHLLTHTSGIVREAPGFDASRCSQTLMSSKQPTHCRFVSRLERSGSIAMSATSRWPK